MIKTIFTSAVFVLLFLTACKDANRQGALVGRKVEMRYAELLKMNEQGDGMTEVEIINPWDSVAVLHRYLLVPKNASVPESKGGAEIVRVPLDNVAVYTSVLCSLIDEMRAFDAIKAVCDLEYIYINKVHEGVKQGRIADLGNSMTPNIEKMMDVQPDAVFLSPMQDNRSYSKLAKLGITIIECADYMESSPLGRAEWVRLYGRLMGREREADSIFAEVEARYNNLKARVADVSHRPTVVTEMKQGSTWYVAGANSTVGIMIADAGGDYIFKDEKVKGAVPYSPEKAFSKAAQADCWLIKYGQPNSMTLEELGNAWGAHRHMKAFKERRVYGCNLSTTHFYETTPFHPDLVLSDMISIFHPDKATGLEMRYYEEMKTSATLP